MSRWERTEPGDNGSERIAWEQLAAKERDAVLCTARVDMSI